MKGSRVNTELRVRFAGKTPYIETREINLPSGKVRVLKTPILPPGASDKAIRAASTIEVFWGPPLNF